VTVADAQSAGRGIAILEPLGPSSDEGGAGAGGRRFVLRSRPVGVRFDLLLAESEPAILRLDLFDDAQFRVVREEVLPNASGTRTWVGRIEGEPGSEVHLTYGDAVMTGTIRLAHRLFRIAVTAAGTHEVQEIDLPALPEEAPPVPVDVPAGVPALPPPPADGASSIDVMVVYTAAVRSAAGGTAALRALIDTGVRETNTGYANSGIAQRITLVRAEEIVYDEAGFEWSTALDRLRGTSDGYMDNVHALRDTYRADVVVLLAETDNAYCGIGYLMRSASSGFAPYAFSVVARACFTGYYSFAHEMGHNMGAHHDWYVASDPGAYDYSHGYAYVPGRWRTVMAYNSECAASGVNCARVNYWSNPLVRYGGVPMGVPVGTYHHADNRTTLDGTAPVVANFRTRSVGPPTLAPIAGQKLMIGGTATLTGTNFTAGSVIKLYVATSRGAEPFGPYVPGAWTPTSLTWNIPSSIPLGNGFGSVQVVNTDAGYTQSNVVGALLEGDPGDNIPTILFLNGVGLGPPDLGIGVAHIDTVVARGAAVTIIGTGFSGPLVNLFTAAGNVGPLAPAPGGTSTTIAVTVPPGAPTGPGIFQVVNRPYSGNVASGAVSAGIGARPTITGVSVAGPTVTVTGTGFSALSVANLYNLQGGGVVNLGGFGPAGARIPLTLVSDTRFTFARPAGAVAGPAFVEVLNPPFIPFSSSGPDPDGAFTLP
jgi:hypothetical protein